MTIAVIHMEFLIPAASSLKDKRRVLAGLKQRMRSRYNCSVAEVGYKDKWARAQVTACVVSDECANANEQVNAIARFASGARDAELIRYEIEML